MDIQEVKTKKEKLAADIKKLIQDFESETGCLASVGMSRRYENHQEVAIMIEVSVSIE